MKRRGLAIVFTAFAILVLIMVVGVLALYVVVGRGPAVPPDAMLTLRVGGDPAEVAPSDVVAYLSEGRAPTVHAITETLRKAKVDDRIRAVLLKPTGFTTPYWGKIQE